MATPPLIKDFETAYLDGFEKGYGVSRALVIQILESLYFRVNNVGIKEASAARLKARYEIPRQLVQKRSFQTVYIEGFERGYDQCKKESLEILDSLKSTLVAFNSESTRAGQALLAYDIAIGLIEIMGESKK